MSALVLPILVLFCLAFGAMKRTPIYDAFLDGVKNGLDTARRVLPPLLAMLCAVSAARASGLMDALCALLAPALAWTRIPAPALPLVFLRPLSGSASLGLLADIMRSTGPDSRASLVAATLAGSGEALFYTLSLYLGATKIKASRHTLPAALLAFLAGCVAAGRIIQ